MAERAEELRNQLDAQRDDITRTVNEIENRVAPGRVLSRRKYRMRRSVMDLKDRLMGNDEPDYPTHWYAQPAAPYGPEYGGQQYGYSTSFEEQGGGGRMDSARERAGEVGDRASGAVHGMQERAAGTMQDVSGRASDTMHDVQGRLHDAPQTMRRQTQGSPAAMGLLAFGAGVLAAALLPETEREQRVARQATPQLQHAVEGAKALGGEVAEQLKEPAQEAVEQVKQTATEEAQALKEDATQEAQAAKSDVQSTAQDAKSDVQSTVKE